MTVIGELIRVYGTVRVTTDLRAPKTSLACREELLTFRREL